ncbi:MAG TPA: FliH/SctL family protein, partial [Steroidobacteraceae bacterium]|nr:FliH/SctL family protein [Steroidobacteraceae bacterium]
RLAELAARIERFDALLRQLAHPLRVLDDEVERSLLTLAVAIASQLTRRTLRAEPEQLIPIVRACLQQLPLGAREVRVRLHPDDAAVVREKLAAPAGEGAWQLVEDPLLTRGGCLIDSEHSRLDARLESRINALIAHALGDERAVARGLPPAPGGDPAS